MQPCKSDSFTFRRNNSATSSTRSEGMQHCRRKLQEKFDESDGCSSSKAYSSMDSNRKVLSVLNLSETRKVLRNGAERISKTFNTVKTSLETFTQVCLIKISENQSKNLFISFEQKFKMSTKRRQILEEGPMTPNPGVTPHTFSRQILGRTPEKLYSPFGIDSPYHPTTCDKENFHPNRQLINLNN